LTSPFALAFTACNLSFCSLLSAKSNDRYPSPGAESASLPGPTCAARVCACFTSRAFLSDPYRVPFSSFLPLNPNKCSLLESADSHLLLSATFPSQICYAGLSLLILILLFDEICCKMDWAGMKSVLSQAFFCVFLDLGTELFSSVR
jgi:hypothetical protein